MKLSNSPSQLVKFISLAILLTTISLTTPSLTISDNTKTLEEWTPAAVVSSEAIENFGIDNCFTSEPISDAVFNRMWTRSYKKNCTVPRESLRYLRILHKNAEGKPQLGELVCNKAIADDLLAIFKTLYENDYKIARMVLIDEYAADDQASMTANNTSCFNYRHVAGSTTLSKHSKGTAIDINPLVNPCVHVRTGKVEPTAGKAYAYNRTNKSKASVQMIDRNDLCYKLFIQHGFRWGGAWNSKKDYQHFEKY